MVQRSDFEKWIGSRTYQRYIATSPSKDGDSIRWNPEYRLAYSSDGHAPPPKISSVPVPWIDGGHVSPSTNTMSSPSPYHFAPWTFSISSTRPTIRPTPSVSSTT